MTCCYELRLRHKSGEETVCISANLRRDALTKKLHDCMFEVLGDEEPSKAISDAVAEHVKTELDVLTVKPDGILACTILFKCSTGDIVGS